MNRKQWIVLAFAFLILGMYFDLLDSPAWEERCEESIMQNEVEMINIYACIRELSFEHFKYVFFTLGIAFLILAWLEPKTKAEIEQKEARGFVKEALQTKDHVWKNKKEQKIWRKYLKRKYPTVSRPDNSKKK